MLKQISWSNYWTRNNDYYLPLLFDYCVRVLQKNYHSYFIPFQQFPHESITDITHDPEEQENQVQ